MRGDGATPAEPSRRRCRAAATAAVALLALAVQLPLLSRGVSLLDEGSVVAIADALARGEVLYRDRIAVVGPLTYEALAAAFAVFGTEIAVARAFQAAVFLVCVMLVLAVLRRVTSEAFALAGALSLLALKPLGFQLWTLANYSQVAMAALLLTLWALLRWLARPRGTDLALAGLAGGLVFLSKQNLGAVAALAVGASVLVVWWRSPPRRLARLLGQAGVLGGAALLPVLAAALAYQSSDALPAVWMRTIESMGALADDWRMPFPPLAPWGSGDAAWGLRAFAYFPQPLVELALAGGFDLAAPPLSQAIEWLVKACYLAPLLGIALIAGGALRADAAAAPRLACALFAAGAYASLSYRPDFAHLMNVWPALHVAFVAGIAVCGRRLRAVLALAGGGVWLALSGLTGWAVAALDWQPLASPRGELHAPRETARTLRTVLDWAAAQPAAERIAFLPAVPALHFLADRPLPLAADALIPGVLAVGDDERLARELDAVEHVVYATQSLPWVRDDVVDVAPQLSFALATRFRLVRQLAPGYLLLEREPRARAEAVHPLWDAAHAGPQREHWLFHRVLAFALQPGERRCAEALWRVASGDRLVATPLARSALWPGDPHGAASLEFELSASAGGDEAAATRFGRLAAGAAPAPWQLALELADGAEVLLHFCVRRAPAGRGGAGPIDAGWAEPRVERAAGATNALGGATPGQ